MDRAESFEFKASVNLMPWRQVHVRRQRRLIVKKLTGCALLGAVLPVAVMLGLGHMRQSLDRDRASLDAQLQKDAAKVNDAKLVSNELKRWISYGSLQPIAQASHQRVLDLLRDLSAQSSADLSIADVRVQGDVIEVKGEARSKGAALDFVRGLKARDWPAATPSVSSGHEESKTFAFLIKPKAKKKK